MTRVDGYSDAGPRDRQLWDSKNLAALITELDLFVRITLIDHGVVHRYNVKGNWHGPFARLRKVTGTPVLQQKACVTTGTSDLSLHLRNTRRTPARYGLIGAHDHPLQSSCDVQRFERGHGHHGRTVRIRNYPLRYVCQRLGVDVGDDERNFR